MEVFSIIIIIMIWVFIKKNIATAQKDKQVEQKYQQSGAASQTATTAVAGNYSSQSGKNSAYSAGQRAAKQSGLAAKNAGTKAGNSASNKADGANQTAGKNENSTLAYLNEKARLDQVEHAKEKLEEERKNQAVLAGRKAALRYLDGDEIPRGMRICRCGYCAADNLLPVGGSRQGFTCYFCREDL